MRLRSFSISKIVPVEILNLIIHESSDSDSTLHAWCLVSFGCLSIAGPLLNEHVQISSNSVLSRVLQRMTFDGDDPLLLPLPRLLVPLSLKNVKRVTFLIQADVHIVESLTERRSPSSHRRRQLVLDFHAQCLGAEEAFVLITFLLPRLVNLLQPLQLFFRLDFEAQMEFTAWALEGYLGAIALIPHIPLKDLPPYHENLQFTVEQSLLAQALFTTGNMQRAKTSCRDDLDFAVGPFEDLRYAEEYPTSLAERALEELNEIRRSFAEEEEPGREALETERVEGRWETAEEVLTSVKEKTFQQIKRFKAQMSDLLDRTTESAKSYGVDLLWLKPRRATAPSIPRPYPSIRTSLIRHWILYASPIDRWAAYIEPEQDAEESKERESDSRRVVFEMAMSESDLLARLRDAVDSDLQRLYELALE